MKSVLLPPRSVILHGVGRSIRGNKRGRGSRGSSCNVSRDPRFTGSQPCENDEARRWKVYRRGRHTREGYIVVHHRLPIGYRVVNLIYRSAATCCVLSLVRTNGTRVSHVRYARSDIKGDCSPRGAASSRACKISGMDGV